ncbi:Gfo/Idh/MocA family protein [Lysobacter korlensis]|uniref:Gfo/Idh/MocA family protein n=1 Tax=Lysobacter korlensis TaxID=553636 RepID=A0ABV6RXI8_9GAMM
MRLYLIGAGAIAHTHAEAAAKLREPVELRVADPSDAARTAFLAAHPSARAFRTAEEMLASEPAAPGDIAVVATPPAFHSGPARAAARSGRNVLCEKPLAMSVAEAEEMLRVATEHGMLLGSCSTRFRGLPHTEAVKRVLASGALGDVYSLTFVTKWPRSRAGIEYQPASRWFLDSSQSGGGVVMDWGPYDMSTLFDILRPTAVEVTDAWIAQPKTGADPTDIVFDTESHAGATLRFGTADGIVHVAFERASATHGEEFARAELSGTLGSLRWTPFDSQQPVHLRTDRDGEPHEEVVEPPERDDLTIFDRPLLHFVAAVAGEPSLASLGRDAVTEFRCLRAIYEVAATGRPARVEVGG